MISFTFMTRIDLIGLVQTLLFSCAEFNVNELEQRILSFALGLAHEKFDILGNEQMLNKC